MRFIFYRLILIVLVVSTGLHAQNLESIGKEDPIKITGGLSLSQILYKSNGISQRRDPYSYFLTGGLTTTIYGFSIPVSFSVSNQNRSFQQPFNQFSINPTYKWVTAHAGYTSMTFSPYTLSGHIFRGAGVELKPGRFEFSAMYGQLRKPVEHDSASSNTPTFARWGYGFKTGYRNNEDFAEVSIFHSEDDLNSLVTLPTSQATLPEENLVLGISLGKQIYKKISVHGEYAASGITRDVREEELGAPGPFDKASYLFQSNTTTSYFHAAQAGLNYRWNSHSVGVKYERIDPGYRTHGAYYFNSDLENYTVNFASNWFGNKLSASANGGVQHDNLDHTKMSTLNRWVGSCNVTFLASEQLNLSAGYSNFQSFTNIRSQFVSINQLTPYDNLDTLRFTQISQNANVNVSYRLKGGSHRQRFILFNGSIQDAANKQSQVQENEGSRFYNSNISYTVSFVPSQLTLNMAYNFSQNRAPLTDILIQGPSCSLAKSMLEKKLRASTSISYNSTRTAGLSSASLLSIRANVSYRVKLKHNLSVGAVALQRYVTQSEMAKAFREYTGTIAYTYSF